MSNHSNAVYLKDFTMRDVYIMGCEDELYPIYASPIIDTTDEDDEEDEDQDEEDDEEDEDQDELDFEDESEEEDEDDSLEPDDDLKEV